MKILFTLILLILFFQVSFGQEKPKAELIDKFGILACEDLKMRIGFFSVESLKDTSSKSFVVIYKSKDGSNPGVWFEKTIFGAPYFFKQKKNDFKVVYGEEKESYEVELWKVPDGAAEPEYLEESKIYTIPNPLPAKPFIFGIEPEDFAVCPIFSPQIYANALKSNPNIKGHIVIPNISKSYKNENINSLVKLLTEEYKIPRNQYKFFFNNTKRAWSPIEFWIVPKKKKL